MNPLAISAKSSLKLVSAPAQMKPLSPPSRKTKPRLWQSTFLLNRALVRQLREATERWFSIESTARVLDVGCGSMPYCSLFAGRCREYVGCDYFPVSDQIVQCPAEALSFDDASFDAVVCLQVLEHLRQPWKAVSECARVAKPGGRVILSAPFLFPHHAAPHDYFRFTHDGLRSMVEEAGLRVDQLTAQCSSLTTVLLIMNFYLARLRNRLNRRLGTRPASWLLIGAFMLPLNLLGVLADAPLFRRPATNPNEGFSNFLLVCRKL